MDDALEPVPFEKVFQKAEKYKNAVKSYQYILDCLLKKPVITKRMFCTLWLDYVLEFEMEGIVRRSWDGKCNLADFDKLCKSLVDNMNEKIGKMGLRLTEHCHEINGESHIVLIATRPWTRCLSVASNFTADEQHLLQEFATKIVTSSDGLFTRDWAAQLAFDLPNSMNAVKLEQFLKRACDEFWLENAFGDYILGVRGAAELMNILLEKYSAPQCLLCDRVITLKTHIEKCPHCNEEIHNCCWKKMCDATSADKIKCPGCRGMLEKPKKGMKSEIEESV